MKIEAKERKNKIYNLKNGVIEVYNFEPYNYKLNLFRLEELKKIPKEEQVLVESPTNGWFTPKKRKVFECDAYVLQGLNLHKMDQIDQHSLMRKLYINGSYDNDVVDVYPDFITLTPDHGCSKYRIQLTEEALLSFLLKNELFDSSFLHSKSLYRQKDLFKISKDPISDVSLKDVETMYESGLIPGTFDDTLTYLDRSSKVFRKMR